MLLMIDNYDSFTYNLVQAFAAQGAEVIVYRNDRPGGIGDRPSGHVDTDPLLPQPDA